MKMKNNAKNMNDTKEEMEFLKDLEEGNFQSVSDLENEKKRIKDIMQDNFYSKKSLISIRLLERDLDKIKAIAIREGVPYQVLIRSIIHKYANR